MANSKSPNYKPPFPCVILVEGRGDKDFFEELAQYLGLNQHILVISVEGEGNFSPELRAVMNNSDFREYGISVAIARDADKAPEKKFNDACKALKEAKLPIPDAPYESIKPDAKSPRVTVAIIPASNTQGSLEDLCLQALTGDQVMQCVDTFFDCLNGVNLLPAEKDRPKARFAAYFAARLDEKEVRGIGLAVKQSWWKEEKIWEHSAFDTLKQFIPDVTQDVK